MAKKTVKKSSTDDSIQTRWTMINGVITFKVTIDGTSGLKWGNRLARAGASCDFSFPDRFFNQPGFKALAAGEYTIKILKGSLFSRRGAAFNFDEVFKRAASLGFKEPSAEVGCLIRTSFTNEVIRAMGLNSILVMHQPLPFDGQQADRRLLWVTTESESQGMFITPFVERAEWTEDVGFAFLA